MQKRLLRLSLLINLFLDSQQQLWGLLRINPKIPNFQPHSPNTHISFSFLHLYALLHILCSPEDQPLCVSVSPSLFLSVYLFCFLFFFLFSLSALLYGACLPVLMLRDKKGAWPGDCVMLTVPNALRFPAAQNLVCCSHSVVLTLCLSTH